jgi:hypothetical protein
MMRETKAYPSGLASFLCGGGPKSSYSGSARSQKASKPSIILKSKFLLTSVLANAAMPPPSDRNPMLRGEPAEMANDLA